MEEQKQFFISSISYHFNLRNPKGEKPTPIYMVVRLYGKQYKFPLGCKVIPSQWNKKKELPFISPYLSKLDNHNNSIVINKISLKKLLIEEILKSICNRPTSESDIIQMFNDKIKEGMTKKNRKNALIDMGNLVEAQRMSDGSKRGYNAEVISFSSFIKDTKGKSILYWEEVTLSLLTEYENWLNRQQVRHKITQELVSIEDNTIIGKMGRLYTIMTYAEQKELIDLVETKLYKLKDKKKRKDKVEENQVYLTEENLTSIKSLNLCGDMQKVRDLFIFQTEVGQRFEDINGLKNPIIKNDKIQIFQSKALKSNKFVYAPLTHTAKNILEKYKYELPKIEINKANKILKDIAKKADICYPVQVVERRGGKPYCYTVEAWQLVGTHTARRSYISNNLKEGKDSNIIRKVTGHSTDSAFNRYNRLSSEDAADVIINNEVKVEQNVMTTQMPSTNLETLNFLAKSINENSRLQQQTEKQQAIIKELQNRISFSQDFTEVFDLDDYLDEISRKSEQADQEDIFVLHDAP